MNQSEDNLIADKDLVVQSLEDQNRFSLIIERYQEKLTRYVRRITSVSSEDQQDILQNVFIKVYLNLNAFDLSLSFNSWIYRIAHNELIDWSRKHKTKLKHGLYDIDDEIIDRTESYGNFLREFEIKENKILIHKVLRKLDFKDREVLTLRFLEEKTYQEMGDILKKPISTIGTLVRRAKISFKKNYKQYYE